jgi:signal peptidase II
MVVLLSLPLYVLDQITKWLVRQQIDLGSAHPVIPGFFDLVYFANTGAAFSILRDSNEFFIVLSLVALIVLAVLARRGIFHDRLSQTALSLLLAGILGNLTDRVNYGHVVDFLLFNLHIRFADPWPAFNVADSCICIAVTLFLIHSFCQESEPAA